MPQIKVKPRPGEDVSVTSEMDDTVEPYLKKKAAEATPPKGEMSQADFLYKKKGLVDGADDSEDDGKPASKKIRVKR